MNNTHLDINIRLIEGRRMSKQPERWRESDARFYPIRFKQLPTNFEQLYRTNEKVEKIRRRWEFLVESIQRQRFQLLRAEHATFAWFSRRNYGHFENSWGEAWRSITLYFIYFHKYCRNYTSTVYILILACRPFNAGTQEIRSFDALSRTPYRIGVWT